jgi:hypothetical protein
MPERHQFLNPCSNNSREHAAGEFERAHHMRAGVGAKSLHVHEAAVSEIEWDTPPPAPRPKWGIILYWRA